MNKICTTIEQSEKLLELGIDVNTADMCWQNNEFPIGFNDDDAIPAWSLAALLGVIPNYKLSSEHNYHTCTAGTPFGKETVAWFDNPIDACVELILKLKEQSLL